MGPESSGLQRRISLIKLDKSREEPKSSAAGERKELMLKSKTLESIFGRLVSLAMRTRGNEAPAWGLRVSHVPFHIRGADAQAAFRELMAAAPRVIIDYGKLYDDDFGFRPNELTPRHSKCAREEDCDGPY